MATGSVSRPPLEHWSVVRALLKDRVRVPLTADRNSGRALEDVEVAAAQGAEVLFSDWTDAAGVRRTDWFQTMIERES